MALNLNAPNFAGLAGMASGGGNLNLTVPGQLALQGLQLNQNRAESRRQNDLALMQIRQQGELGLREQIYKQQALQQQQQIQQAQLKQTDQQRMLDQQRLQQEGLRNTQQLGMDQQKLDFLGLQHRDQISVEQQKIFAEKQQKEMAKILDEKKEKIKEKGAFASYAMISMKQAKNPEEANILKTEILQEALQKGYMDKTEANVARRMPTSMFINGLGMKIMQYGLANEHKALLDSQKEKSVSGQTEVYDPETGNLIYRKDPGKAQENKLGEQIGDAMVHLNRLKNIGEKHADEFLTFEGDLKSGYGWIASKSPSLSKFMPKSEEAKEFRGKKSAFVQDVNKLFSAWVKEMTGASFAIQELELRKKEMINEDDDPVAFKAKYDALLDDMKQATMIRQDLLKNKIPIGSKEFEQQFKEKMKYFKDEEKPANYDEGLAQHFRDNGKSEEEINAYFKGKK